MPVVNGTELMGIVTSKFRYADDTDAEIATIMTLKISYNCF